MRDREGENIKPATMHCTMRKVRITACEAARVCTNAAILSAQTLCSVFGAVWGSLGHWQTLQRRFLNSGWKNGALLHSWTATRSSQINSTQDC